MKHERIIAGLYSALVWAVGIRYLTGTQRPQHIRCISHEVLGNGLVKLIVPTADGPEVCFAISDLPEAEIAAAIHGPYASAGVLQHMEAVGNA